MAGGGWGDGQGPDGGDLVGPNPTDRAKRGVKRSLHVEGDGGPLGIVVAGANRPDFQLLAATLDACVVGRPNLSPALSEVASTETATRTAPPAPVQGPLLIATLAAHGSYPVVHR